MSEEKISLTSQPSTGPQPGDQAFVPPATAVPLPSAGKIYPPGNPLHGKELVEIKAMTAKEEDILTSRALIKQGKVLDVLLKSCVVDKTVDVDGMLSGDRNAALIAIRITGYGQQYTVDVTCPVCDEKSKHTFDLATLPIKRIGAEPVSPGTNEFSFVLPVSRKEVTFKLLTGADERELATILDRTKKSGGLVESLVTTRIFQQLLSVAGERDRNKISAMVRHMPARDSRELRRYMDQVAPGVDMKQVFACPACNEESEVDVPMGTEFFWPES